MITKISINSAILKWARERQGFSQEEVALKFKKDASEIAAWESGKKTPTYVQLEKLAYEIYKRPIALFFFPEPPEEEPLEKSFRTLPEIEISKISPKLRTIIRKAKATQIALKSLINSNDIRESIVKNLKFSTKVPINELVKSLRNYLNISLEEQFSWKDSDTAFKNWRIALEKKGIFIFKEAFYDKNFSGFCLHDVDFPLIYLNNSQPINRQIFSLFHEIAHLLFGVGGVESNSLDYINFLEGESKIIEIVCNRFAGAFLVPDNFFDKTIQNNKFSEEFLNNLANKFCVSREVILRKFYDRKIINQLEYDNFIKKWKKQQKEAGHKKPGGNYYKTQGVYISENYAVIIFQQYYQNRISLSDVASYLGVKIKSVEGIEASFLKKQLV